jgi:hypothetical protein
LTENRNRIARGNPSLAYPLQGNDAQFDKAGCFQRDSVRDMEQIVGLYGFATDMPDATSHPIPCAKALDASPHFDYFTSAGVSGEVWKGSPRTGKAAKHRALSSRAYGAEAGSDLNLVRSWTQVLERLEISDLEIQECNTLAPPHPPP